MLNLNTAVTSKFEGWDPADMFNLATFCIYVPVPSQEPVIHCRLLLC